jgi:hypothetical protein
LANTCLNFWTALRYREYESLVDEALADFAVSEELGRRRSSSDVGGVLEDGALGATMELRRILSLAAADSATKSAHKSLGMLAAAGDYRKFVAMMAARASEAGR